MAGLILASNSPRRKEILKQAGIDFEVFSVEQEEYSEQLEPEEFVKELAFKKAENAVQEIEEKKKWEKEDKMIIGADTIVVQDGKILGKPINDRDTFSMINSLQGKTHQVFTGVAVLILKNGRKESICFAEKTLVKVYPMDVEEIQSYISTGESFDKAGGYAIQGRFGQYIEGIIGDYYNVVGFPLSRFYQEMKKRGLLDNLMISC